MFALQLHLSRMKATENRWTARTPESKRKRSFTKKTEGDRVAISEKCRFYHEIHQTHENEQVDPLTGLFV
jgi:hypothetical protein